MPAEAGKTLSIHAQQRSWFVRRRPCQENHARAPTVSLEFTIGYFFDEDLIFISFMLIYVISIITGN